MNRWRQPLTRGGPLLLAAMLAAGCVSRTQARLEARDALLTGQNTALMREQGRTDMPTVTIIGPVQRPNVPWIPGMTLVQALAAANDLDARGPGAIVIIRGGESATLDPRVLFNGAVVPLEAGDVIELR